MVLMFPYNFFLRVCFLKSVLLHSRISSMAVQEFCSRCYLTVSDNLGPTFIHSYQTTASGRLGFKHSRIVSLLIQLALYWLINLVSCLSYRDFQVHIGVVLKSMTEFVKVVAKTSRSPLQRQPRTAWEIESFGWWGMPVLSFKRARWDFLHAGRRLLVLMLV